MVMMTVSGSWKSEVGWDLPVSALTAASPACLPACLPACFGRDGAKRAGAGRWGPEERAGGGTAAAAAAGSGV